VKASNTRSCVVAAAGKRVVLCLSKPVGDSNQITQLTHGGAILGSAGVVVRNRVERVPALWSHGGVGYSPVGQLAKGAAVRQLGASLLDMRPRES